MLRADDLSTYLGELLVGTYDCPDRIALRAYYPLGQTSGGLLAWWAQLCPGVPLTQKRLRGMAGDFGRRLAAFARKHQVPLQYCPIGDRTKHARAEKLQPPDPKFQGVFAIFGRKHRPHHTQAGGGRLEKILDRSVYDLTVFKLHFGKLTLKLYDKGDRVLRVEVIVNNIEELRCGKRLEKMPGMLTRLQTMVVEFLAVVQAAHLAFLDGQQLDALAAPTVRGGKRLAGVDLQKPRMRAVAEAVLALAPAPEGFSAKDLAQRMRQQQGRRIGRYDGRRAAYDLRKLRGKGLVERRAGTRRYRVRRPGIRTLAGLYIVREKVLKPVLAGVCRPKRGRPPKSVHPLDVHYERLQREMLATLRTLQLAA
jgi:hypothetical protein